MEKEKGKNLVIILLSVTIVILSILCVLFATGTVNLKSEKGGDTNSVSPSEKDNQQQNNDNAIEKEVNWVDYILSQHILEASASTVEKETTISLNDLKNILPTFESTKIVKAYYGPRGSMVDGVTLHIEYENNENKYYVNISTNNNYCELYGSNMDKALENIFENAKESEKNIELKESGKYSYELDSCDSSVLDKYK